MTLEEKSYYCRGGISMAHTNQTPNYELSQFLGTDKPAWLVDYNGDMEKIDLGLKAAKDVADAAKAEADQGVIDIAAVTVTANSADAKASGAISDLSDAYDATSTYNVGDFVIYNNILYRCITAITVPESFDGTHWVRTTVEEIITQINSDLTELSTYEAQAFNPANYGNLYNFAKITRHGNVCMIELHGFKTMIPNYENTILGSGAIIQSLRPREDTVFTISDPSGTAYRVRITAAGGMTVYMYSGGSGDQLNVVDFLCYVI
jgi:hypothetical protein